jgi:nitric oxide dioxygenase
MTSTEILLVQDTFRQIARISDQAAALFYARLFELDPSLRPMFRGDMAEQGRKLMHVLALAVSSLNKLETLLPAVRQLGINHTGYGVREEHYATVGAALLWTLEKGLGPAFTPEVRAAWTETYATLANVMQDAARGANAVAA